MAAAKKPDQLIDILQQIQARKTVKPEDAAKALQQYYKVQDHIKALRKEIEIFKTNRVQQASAHGDIKDQPGKPINGKAGTRDSRRDSIRQTQSFSGNAKPVVDDIKQQNGQRRASGPSPSPGFKQAPNTRQVTQTNNGNGNNTKQVNQANSNNTKPANQSDSVKQVNGAKPTNGLSSRRTSIAQSLGKENKGSKLETPRNRDDDPLQAKLAQQAKDISEKDQEIARLRFQNAQLKVTVENRATGAISGQQPTDVKSMVSTTENTNFPNPQKLVVDFKVLYEHEWKSAFHDLDKHYKLREDVITELLSGVAKEAYNFCQNAAKQQYEDINKSHAHVLDVLVQPRYVTLSNKDVMTPKSKAIIDKNGYQATRTFLKKYRRAMARVPVSGLTELFEAVVQKDVLSRHTSLRITPKSLRPYIHRLVEVDWLMSISEPPLFQMWPRGGQLMSREMFVPYDKKGATIIHTVWPAILMYKDGPIADKGVCLVK